MHKVHENVNGKHYWNLRHYKYERAICGWKYHFYLLI